MPKALFLIHGNRIYIIESVFDPIKDTHTRKWESEYQMERLFYTGEKRETVLADRDAVKWHVDFSPPDISETEIEEVAETLRSGWITTGPRTKELERQLAGYFGTNRAVCLNSATAAEELNFRIAGIGQGDEVIVPAYTYTATAAAALHVGAKVVFVDSQPDSPEMDYDAMEEAITPRTKAIVPVDLGGVICDYDRIYRAVERQRDKFSATASTDLGKRIQSTLGRVMVIADCAHAMGARKKVDNEWIAAGSLADFSSFSFHAVKNFTTAEGGASTWRTVDSVDDEEIYRWFQLYSLHGQNKDALAKTQLGAWEYDIIAPLYKCNMTDIMAAIGLKQLERYPGMLARRRELIERYDKALLPLGIQTLAHYTEGRLSSGHLYITRVPGITGEQRNEIIRKMGEAGIVCNVHYKPLPLMSGYKALGYEQERYPNAVRFYENEITLPLHTRLTDEEAAYVADQYCLILKECL